MGHHLVCKSLDLASQFSKTIPYIIGLYPIYNWVIYDSILYPLLMFVDSIMEVQPTPKKVDQMIADGQQFGVGIWISLKN